MVRAFAILGLFFVLAHAKAGILNPTNLQSAVFISSIKTPKDIPIGLFQIEQKALRKLEGHKKRKFLAMIMSFPLPFGVLGVHRLYLGSKPIVPIAYLVTFGGGFGILPFIDFTVIFLSENLQPYEGNSNLLMWNMEKP